jgi:ribosome-associated heat shock protein Hsp15
LAAAGIWPGKEVSFSVIPFARDREPPTFAVALFSDADNSDASSSRARLDKWLWAVRIFKTRALATDACRAGSVEVNDQIAKPARDLHQGELVTVKLGLVIRTLKVVAVPRSRVGAKLVPTYCTDLTPPEEYEKLRQDRLGHVLAREKGSGRPTKRDRRDLARLFEGRP